MILQAAIMGGVFVLIFGGIFFLIFWPFFSLIVYQQLGKVIYKDTKTEGKQKILLILGSILIGFAATVFVIWLINCVFLGDFRFE